MTFSRSTYEGNVEIIVMCEPPDVIEQMRTWLRASGAPKGRCSTST